MNGYRVLASRLTVAASLLLATPSLAQEATLPPLEPPVLVTSSGQALDAFTVKTLLGRAGVENTYDPLATADALEGVNTLVIAFGASLKGFGAAGITIENELERTQALLDAAEAQGITVIGVHIGGEERRDPISEQIIDVVAPQADALVVWEPGNADDRFTRVAEEQGVPLVTVEQPMQVGELLAGQVATN